MHVVCGTWKKIVSLLHTNLTLMLHLFLKKPKRISIHSVRLVSLTHSSREGPCLITSPILVCLKLTWKRGEGAQHRWLDSKVLHTVRFLELKPLEKKKWSKGEISYSVLLIYILVVPFPTPEVTSAAKHHKHKQNRVPFRKSPWDVIRLAMPYCSCENWQIANNSCEQKILVMLTLHLGVWAGIMLCKILSI